jgi:predicted permease
MLRREPTFALGVVLTFALAIGANATMFGLVDRLMLSAPNGIRSPEPVARARFQFNAGDDESFVMSTTSYPAFLALYAATNAFASVAASRADTALIGRNPDVTQISTIDASGDYFTLLGTAPARGRFFGPGDDVVPFGTSVIVLGYDYWQRAFAGSGSAIGQQVIVNDQPFTIIGVAPRDFNGDGLAAVDAYLPLTAAMRNRGSAWLTTRDLNVVSLLVRLRDGVTSNVAAQMATAGLRDETSSRGQSRSISVELESIIPGKAARSSAQGQIAIWLTGVSLIVLLIGTANVGTLFALRSARRKRDVAVRVALGAGQSDLARQLIVEAICLATLGAAIGLIFARWFSQLLRVVLLPSVATSGSFVDRRVLAASAVVAMLAAIGTTIVPLMQRRGVNLVDDLRSGGAQGASFRFRAQSLLVSVQTALCMLLLVGAALFVRSLKRVESQDLGLDTSKLLYVTLDFRERPAANERDQFYRDAAERIRHIANIQHATVVAGIPFGPHNIPPVSVPGFTWPPNTQPPIMYGATTDYLTAMGVQLVSGRLFNARDMRGAPQVVLVNETMARTAWPGQSALGKCVRSGFATIPPDLSSTEDPSANAPCREVVGVVRDSRARSLRPEHNEDRLMQYYLPFDQIPDAPFPDAPSINGLIVQSRGEAAGASAAVQRAILSGANGHVFAHVQPYQDLIDPQLRSWRLGATLFSAMGVLALLIATAGLIGVVSYVVTQRMREMGVRLALGGTRTAVVVLIVRDALRMSSIGISVGIVGSLAIGPLIAAMLFQISPRDVASLITSAAILLLATGIAAAWPAWRAARVNPVIALRADG